MGDVSSMFIVYLLELWQWGRDPGSLTLGWSCVLKGNRIPSNRVYMHEYRMHANVEAAGRVLFVGCFV